MTNVNAPTLTDHAVYGIQGFNDTLDTFQFTINYTDLDNLPPITLDLNITGISELISFTKILVDDNYFDGCLYSAQFHFYNTGIYQYHIIAWDGMNLIRSPNIGNHSVEVVPISDAIYDNYTWTFPSTSKWNLDGGWNYITQSNVIDRRSTTSSTWNALYFGEIDSITTGQYSYEAISELSISTVTSPQFWLNDSSNPIMQIATRISITQGDYFIINARSNRTGLWNTLDSFTNMEREWTLLEFDLSDYLSTYIQFQFIVILDFNQDIELNKGILLTEFRLLHQPISNNNPTVIFNGMVQPETG